MNILVVNAGSSTVKLKLFDMKAEEALFSASVEGIGESGGTLVVRDGPGGDPASADTVVAANHREGMELLCDRLFGPGSERPAPAAIGHRIVHGGERFRYPCLVDGATLDDLRDLTPLAPLHNPANLAGIRVMGDHFPVLPQAVCFDTAFHADQPPEATAIAIPSRYRKGGVRRYGFHGLSFEHVAAVLPGLAGGRAQGRVIVAHLGSGVSLCAMQDLKSIATTMGFSTLDGPPMATRSGSLDPGVILHLLAGKELDGEALTDLLYRRSGLLGLSGISGDMRILLADPSPEAAAAVGVFVYRVVREIGSLAAALGGLDLLVFTGGVGENASIIRSQICAPLGWLGVELDVKANEQNRNSIGTAAGPVGVCVVPAEEELVIARHTARLLQGQRPENMSSREEST